MTATIGPWREVPRPSDAPEVVGAWEMARIGSEQDARAVRALWNGDELLAVGGVVQFAQGEGLAFLHVAADLPRRYWRLGWATVHSIVWWAHERGLRVVTAMVVASHTAGHRLIRRLGFEPYGWAPGFASSPEPMIRYHHCAPSFEEPALVRHQRFELWRAMLATWCPTYLAELG